MNPGDIVTLVRKTGRVPARVLEVGVTRAVVQFVSSHNGRWTMPQDIVFSSFAPATQAEIATLEQQERDLQKPAGALRRRAGKAKPKRRVAPAVIIHREPLADCFCSKIAVYSNASCRIVRDGPGSTVYIQTLNDKRWTIVCVPVSALFEPQPTDQDALVTAEYQYPLDNDLYCCEPMQRFIAGGFFSDDIGEAA